MLEEVNIFFANLRFELEEDLNFLDFVRTELGRSFGAKKGWEIASEAVILSSGFYSNIRSKRSLNRGSMLLD